MTARQVLGFGGLLALAGCAQPPPPPPAVVAEAAPVLPPSPAFPRATRARVCVSPYRVGRHSADAGAAMAMTISNDGGWCAHGLTYESFPFKGGNVVEQPQHGEARLRHLARRSVIEYRAVPGYVGSDQFSVTVVPGNATYLVSVAVQP